MPRITKVQIEEKATEVLQRTGTYRVPVPVEVVALRHGLEVEAAALGDGVSGVLIVQGDRGSIGYNETHAAARQRFSIAHELGHFVLHRNEPETANLFIDKKFAIFLRDEQSAEGAELREIQANHFAAALLMPADALRKEIASGEFDLVDDDSLAELAERFEVSARALSIRLATLKLI